MIATAISTYRTLWRYLLKFYSQESNPALLMTCTKREASRLPSEDKGASKQKRTYRTRTSRGQAGSLPQSHGTSISRRTPRGGKSRSLPAQNTNGAQGSQSEFSCPGNSVSNTFIPTVMVRSLLFYEEIDIPLLFPDFRRTQKAILTKYTNSWKRKRTFCSPEHFPTSVARSQ